MPKPRIWKAINDEHKNDLIDLVMYGQNLARKSPSMKRLAVYLIKVAGWRWTADAVDTATDLVIPDAIKYDIRYLPHSSKAAQITALYPKEFTKFLTHEHSVPLSMIAEWVMKMPADKTTIRQLFDNYCRAAILTREEDKILSTAKLRSAMPQDWKLDDDIFARYKSVGLDMNYL